jgi:phosphoglycerate kinase
MPKKTIRDIDVSNKRVLVRVDFNVPIDKSTGEILDDTRITAALPTINYLREHHAKTVLVSHLGRPGGQVVESLRLAPIAARLGELLGADVRAAGDVAGPSARQTVDALTPGDVAVLENVRFEPGEEKNDPALAEKLAAFGDVYVNDAFGTAHRAHASTEGVAHILPAVAGFLMEKEIDYLGRVVSDAERPLAAIIGGAKISTKIAVLRHLLSKVDTLLIGGGMANTFLKAQGVSVGSSLVEDDRLDEARAIMREATDRNVELGLPIDAVVGARFAADAKASIATLDDVPAGAMILDVGPKTVQEYETKLAAAKTVVWNGPLGVAEWDAFAQGSVALARYLAKSDATVIIGGGETVALVSDLGLAPAFAHVSTGGGASLEFLEGRTLPGVAALQDR